MKIAVYSICKNEESRVAAYLKTAQEADAIFVVDTGSSDNTVSLLRQNPSVQLQIVKINPWRFDVARNVALDMISKDYDLAVWLDLDEEFQPGWRQIIESHYDPSVEIYRNPFKNTTSGYEYMHTKIHRHSGVRWIYPIHERLAFATRVKEKFIPELLCFHHQDPDKNRLFYIEMMEKYLAEGELPLKEFFPILLREYFVNRDYSSTVKFFESFRGSEEFKQLHPVKQANSLRYYITALEEVGPKPSPELILEYASVMPTRDHFYVAASVLNRIGSFEHAMDCLNRGDEKPEIDWDAEFIHPSARTQKYEILRSAIRARLLDQRPVD